jgi:hypothetical protein
MATREQLIEIQWKHATDITPNTNQRNIPQSKFEILADEILALFEDRIKLQVDINDRLLLELKECYPKEFVLQFFSLEKNALDEYYKQWIKNESNKIE